MVAITVGVACYNVEAWVEECLASLFGQTFSDFEIIAIDDGSTDRTGALLDSLAAHDDRLRVIHQENAGLGSVKNKIVREARGRFIMFVDGDDWLTSECLEKTYRHAVKNDLDIVSFGWIRIEDETGRILRRRNDQQNCNAKSTEEMHKKAFSGPLNLMSCASLVRRSLFIENNLVFPSVHHEDIYITPFLYFYGRRFDYVDRDMYYWRMHKNSITEILTKSRIDALTNVFWSWKERLSREGQFENYRGAVITGSISWMLHARLLIADQGNGSIELLDHFRNRVLSIPELIECRKYLSDFDLKRCADVISIIEQTPSARNGRPRMKPTLEVPDVTRRLIRICRNRGARSFVGRRLMSPTAALLAAGLALTGAAHAGPAWSAWLPVPGLALVCFVIIKEAVLWRWRRERDLARSVAQWEERTQSLSEALSVERARSERALSEAVSLERAKWGQSLSEALSVERARSERALSEAVSLERAKWGQSLSEALSVERARSEQVLSVERSRRSLVDVHLADQGLPVRRILLLFTMHRAGSTWLFDLLRTHSAVRVEPTARVWTALGLDGWRYPGAFHHVDGASVPLEIKPGLGAAIPAFPRVDIPVVGKADQWVLEKGHPEFVGFEANRLAAKVRDLRARGVEVEVVYGVRCPLDSMWSMAEFKAREPSWLRKIPLKEVAQHTLQSLVALEEARSLIGGAVVEYESLPDGPALRRLCRGLAPGWSKTEVDTWFAHAAAVTERAKRRQREGAGFLGDRDPAREPGGPEGIWLSCAAEMEEAKAVYRRLVEGE